MYTDQAAWLISTVLRGLRCGRGFPGTGRGGAAEEAAFDAAYPAVVVAKRGSEGVLAANDRVEPLGHAGDLRHIAHQEAGNVEKVQADVHQAEVLDLGEVGLVGVDVVGVAERQAGEERAADAAGVDLGPDQAEGAFPAEVLVNDQRPAGAVGGLDHGEAVGVAFGKGLLADGERAARQRQFHQRAVARDGGGNVDEVGLHLGEHRRRIGVDGGHVEGAGEVLRLRPVEVADRDDVGAWRVRPAVHVIAGEEAAADQGTAKRRLFGCPIDRHATSPFRYSLYQLLSSGNDLEGHDLLRVKCDWR